ncbi:hypothetical protein JHK86_047422 [Glycine max]|nr:hypothetical protein JHK86_047422 [Glycine max]
MRVVFGTGLGKEKGEAEELAMFSRLATRRRRSSNLSVTTIWLEARWEIASSIRSNADLVRGEFAMEEGNESTRFVKNQRDT